MKFQSLVSHRSISTIPFFRSLVLVFLAFALPPNPLQAMSLDTIPATTWVKIHHPDSSLRDILPASALDYGAFIWMPLTDIAEFQIKDFRIEKRLFPFRYQLDQQTYDPLQGFDPSSVWFAERSIPESDFHLIQFKGPMKNEWLEQLKGLNIEPIQALSPYSYIVWARADEVSKATDLTSVRWQGDFYSAFRVPQHHRELNRELAYGMALIHRKTASTVLTQMRTLGALIQESSELNAHLMIVNFSIAGNRFIDLANSPGIYTVQRVSQDAGLRSETSQQSIVGNYDSSNLIFPGYADWLTDSAVSGDAVTVGIVDGGIFDTHPDLVSNMASCTGPGASCGSATNSHGTHVAGAVAGSAESGVMDSDGFLRGQGVAPGASVIKQLYAPLLGNGPGGMTAGGMLVIYRDSAISGAQLTNNSWGPTGTPQGYDIPTMEIDFITRDADPMMEGAQPVLAVWSIMNGQGDGFGSCSPSSLGSPDEAKNLFAIGSTRLYSGGTPTTELFDISSNSAHGPACDGRLVPHIVAPGCSTDSPDSATGYGFKCGTSMASPVISGSVALFWERYRSMFAKDPSPALVKAIFSATALNLKGMRDADGATVGQRPNRTQGWGRVDLDSVINPPHSVWYFDQEEVFTNTGEQFVQDLVADKPLEPVKLMLVWTDAPGAGLGGGTSAWVNDLDLNLIAADITYVGNDFAADGFAAVGGDADLINNMEAIFLRADQHNGKIFSVNVTASNLASDALNPYKPVAPSQDFALVCYNCKAVDEGLIFNDGFEN